MNFPHCPFIVIPKYTNDESDPGYKIKTNEPIYCEIFDDLNNYLEHEGYFPGCSDKNGEKDEFTWRISYSGGWGLGYSFYFMYDNGNNKFLCWSPDDNDDIIKFGEFNDGDEMFPEVFVKNKKKRIIESNNFWKIYGSAFIYANVKIIPNGGLKINHPSDNHRSITINFVTKYVPKKNKWAELNFLSDDEDN